MSSARRNRSSRAPQQGSHPHRKAPRHLDDPRDQRPNRRILLPAILILVVEAAVLITYWPVLSSEALYIDDAQYLTRNHLVQKPGWTSTERFFTEVLHPSTVRGYYQPLAMVSLMLDYGIAGSTENLRPFRRTSLILHCVNTALVILLLYLLFDQIWIAAAVGLLFGVHPVAIESIAWLAERKTVLAAMFALCCLVMYLRYVRRRKWTLYGACLAAYVLALLTKPTATPVPLLLLLLDWWPLRRLSKRAVLEKIPFLLIGGISAIVTVVSQARSASLISPREHSPLTAVLTLCHNIVFYPFKLLWPAKLSWFYPFPEPLSLSHPMVLAGVIGTGLLIVLLLLSLRRTRALVAGWLFFFVAIFPTMGVVGFTVMIAADRFVYLPMIGFLLSVTWVLSRLWHGGSYSRARTARRVAIVVGLATVATSEALATRHYLAHWKDSESLYRYLVTLAPQVPVLRTDLGNALRRQDRFEEAIVEYQAALRIDPTWTDAHHNLGMTLYLQGHNEEAVMHARAALRSNVDVHTTHNNLGLALINLGKRDEGMAHLLEAVKLEPEYAEGHYNLGVEFLSEGQVDKAIEHLERALYIRPHYADAHVYMGGAWSAKGRVDTAITHYREAIRLDPTSYAAHNNLGIALAEQGETEAAIRAYTEAIRLQPRAIATHNNLALLLAADGRTKEAIAHFEAALRIEPGAVDIRANLGEALFLEGRIDEAIVEFRRVLRTNPDHEGALRRLDGMGVKRSGP